MSSPGKYLYELAKHIEVDLKECGRQISCVDLAYGSSVNPPQLQKDCKLKVDVGPYQQPFRAIDTRTGESMVDKGPNQTCTRGWRFAGFVRVTAPYTMSAEDCCHEHSLFTYEFANTIFIVSESVQTFLNELTQDDSEPASGESTQTEYVTSYGGGAVTVGIHFTARVCFPGCEDLMAEEAEMREVIEAARKAKKC